jgi:hypothetical protein
MQICLYTQCNHIKFKCFFSRLLSYDWWTHFLATICFPFSQNFCTCVIIYLFLQKNINFSCYFTFEHIKIYSYWCHSIIILTLIKFSYLFFHLYQWWKNSSNNLLSKQPKFPQTYYILLTLTKEIIVTFILHLNGLRYILTDDKNKQFWLL